MLPSQLLKKLTLRGNAHEDRADDVPKAAYNAIVSPHPPPGKTITNGRNEPVTPTTPVAVYELQQEQTAHIPIGAWSTGLFNCFDVCVPNCFMATFCPCVSAAQIAARLGFNYLTALVVFGTLIVLECILYGLMKTVSTDTNYDDEEASFRMNVWGYIAFLLSIVTVVAFWQLRTKVRQAFELPGTCIEDLFVSWCCSCCSLAQMATHVKSYKPRACDFGPPDELPAYDTHV